jgi:hypothetical protein
MLWTPKFGERDEPAVIGHGSTFKIKSDNQGILGGIDRHPYTW